MMINSQWSALVLCMLIGHVLELAHNKLGHNGISPGADPGGPQGPGPPLTTKNKAPAPKFYKTEAPEWQF